MHLTLQLYRKLYHNDLIFCLSTSLWYKHRYSSLKHHILPPNGTYIENTNNITQIGEHENKRNNTPLAHYPTIIFWYADMGGKLKTKYKQKKTLVKTVQKPHPTGLFLMITWE